MTSPWPLLLVFQAKHFLADYPLQGRYMLGKFRDHGWVLPLAAHAGVHALFTACIALAWGASLAQGLGLTLFDAGVHFTMDRVKADRKLLGRYKSLTADTAPTATPAQWRSNDRFWWSLGFDQMVHHLTHYAIAYYLVTR